MVISWSKYSFLTIITIQLHEQFVNYRFENILIIIIRRGKKRREETRVQLPVRTCIWHKLINAILYVEWLLLRAASTHQSRSVDTRGTESKASILCVSSFICAEAGIRIDSDVVIIATAIEIIRYNRRCNARHACLAIDKPSISKPRFIRQRRSLALRKPHPSRDNHLQCGFDTDTHAHTYARTLTPTGPLMCYVALPMITNFSSLGINRIKLVIFISFLKWRKKSARPASLLIIDLTVTDWRDFPSNLSNLVK